MERDLRRAISEFRSANADHPVTAHLATLEDHLDTPGMAEARKVGNRTYRPLMRPMRIFAAPNPTGQLPQKEKEFAE